MNSTATAITGGSWCNAYGIARLLLSIVFIASGVSIMQGFAAMVALAGQLGVPSPALSVGLSVALDIIGGVLVITNRFVWAVGILWIGFLLIATPIFHWPMVNDAVDPNQMNHFLKNVSLVGGILLLVVMDKNKPAALSWLNAK